ncbi:protein YIPF2 isoform X2 [Corvus cornix cornix]|uniref:protein YIPF2 isoform X2 n=1 Tax=Corvus cornix cornix TaxID=932674 RepID=UPI00195088D2|nr:protein YIPF2 isoform X2 [Corvus cornix cornix]
MTGNGSSRDGPSGTIVGAERRGGSAGRERDGPGGNHCRRGAGEGRVHVGGAGGPVPVPVPVPSVTPRAPSDSREAPEPRSGPSVAVPLPEPPEDGDDADTAELLAGQRQPRGFWTFEYYQAFFDVDTRQVLERIKASVLPVPGKNFVRHRLRNNPDLYGPFWICATLALALAISGDLSQLGAARGGPEHRYRPRFHHALAPHPGPVPVTPPCPPSARGRDPHLQLRGLVPLGLWGALSWARGGSGGSFSLLETLCAYGYSLAALVPAAVLWALPVPWLRWAVLAVLAVPSAAALAVTFWPPLRAGGRVPALAGGPRWWPCTPCWPWAASSTSSSPSPQRDLGGPPWGSPPPTLPTLHGEGGLGWGKPLDRGTPPSPPPDPPSSEPAPLREPK